MHDLTQLPDFESMNETDVREVIIRPLIERLGYRHGGEARILTEKTLRYERSFLGKKNPRKDPPLIGRADYICELVSFGRWVIEVKPPSQELSQDVVEQAHTYATHPEIAASFFLVSNGRNFRLFETAKPDRAALEWVFEDQDGIFLRLFNVLSPDAFKKRAKLYLVDPGKPLGKGLASKLRIIGGMITYEEHEASHPILDRSNINGLRLPVTGGYVRRAEDKRIIGHVQVAKAAPLIEGVSAAIGTSDDYDFFSATEYLSNDPNHPTIFQNRTTNTVPEGKIISTPGMRFPMPLEMSTTTFTEAIAFAKGDKFIGTMRLSYEFTFSQITLQIRAMLESQVGHIPNTAYMAGAGQFEIFFQDDI